MPGAIRSFLHTGPDLPEVNVSARFPPWLRVDSSPAKPHLGGTARVVFPRILGTPLVADFRVVLSLSGVGRRRTTATLLPWRPSWGLGGGRIGNVSHPVIPVPSLAATVPGFFRIPPRGGSVSCSA